MVIYIKNPKLHKRIFGTLKKYDNLAIKHYEKGKMKLGQKYENKSDKLYAKYYNRMFGITKDLNSRPTFYGFKKKK